MSSSVPGLPETVPRRSGGWFACCLILGVAACVAIFWGSAFYHLHRVRQDELAQARRDATNLSVALAEQVSRLLTGADQVMQLMQDDYRRDPRRFDFAAWLARATSLRGVANQVAMFDARGDLIAARSPVPPGAAPVNVADRAYFAHLATHRDAGLYVGRTLPGRITNGPKFPIARRLEDASGAFAGVLVVAIDTAYLQQQFQAIDIGKDGNVSLHGLDGYLRVRTPFVEGVYDHDAPQPGATAGVFRHLRTGPQGIFELADVYDGIHRLYGYKLVEGFPLTLVVGRSLAEILRPVWDEARRTDAAAAAATLLVLALASALAWEIRRRTARERDLRASEHALREAEAGFRGVFESSADILCVHRIARDGTITLDILNSAAAAARNLDPASAPGKRLEDLLPPDVARAARAQIERVVASGTSLRTQDNRTLIAGRCYETDLVPLFENNDSGRVTRVFVSIRDVTHLREADAAIARSEARFRLLAENAGEMIILAQDDGRRSYVSPASLRLVGYTPAEFSTMGVTERVHPDDVEPLERTLMSMRAGAIEASVTCRFQHRDGDWRWLESMFRRVPHPMAVGELTSDARGPGGPARQPTIVVTVRDVSERQAQSRALEEAKRAAEEASSAKTDFLATMSHEIRTPLNGILGYTDLLLGDGGFDGERRRHAERIRSAGAALRTVVDDILDFSRIEAGRIDLDPLPFDLANLVADAVAIVAGSVGTKQLDIVTDLDPRLPSVLVGDQDRLRQILLNLLNNAVKFTPAGGVFLSVASLNPSRSGVERLRFTVTDTGIGVPSEKRAILFERFSQADGSIRRSYGGSGLGLAICRSLVEAMGGTIGVTGREGQGSTFWFELALPADGAGPESVGQGTPAARVRRALILLVDDQEINQALVKAVLEAEGHEVVVAGDGAEAVRIVRSRPFDLVLMDAQMPVMDGIGATRRIRGSHHSSRDVPIVAMSANVLPAQVATLLAAGMDDHVGKPFRQSDLCAAIARWMPAQPGAYPTRATAAATIDIRAFDELRGGIGEAKLRALTRSALDQVASLAAKDTSTDRSTFAGAAHAMVAVTGTLGLRLLSGLLKDLETACADGVGGEACDLDGSLRAIGREVARARSALAGVFDKVA